MKLRDYFEAMKHKKLTDDTKNRIYQRIVSHQNSKSTYQSEFSHIPKKKGLFSRVRNTTSRLSFTAISTIATLCLFVLFAFQAPVSFWQSIGGIWFADTVQAEKIGTVLYVQGWYQRQGQEDETLGRPINTLDTISDGDVLYVNEGSSMRLQIQDSHYAQVQGPATLKIYRVPSHQSVSEEYRVVFLQGSILSIESGDANNSLFSLVGDRAKVSVQTSEGTVVETQQSSRSKQRVLIKQSSQTQIIANDGDEDLKVQSTKDQKSITIPQKQAIVIDNQKETTVAVALDTSDDVLDTTTSMSGEITNKQQAHVTQQKDMTLIESTSSQETMQEATQEATQETQEATLEELMLMSMRTLEEELSSIERSAQDQLAQQSQSDTVAYASGSTFTGDVFTGNILTGNILTGNILTGNILTGTFTGNVSTGMHITTHTGTYTGSLTFSGMLYTGTMYQTGILIYTGSTGSGSSHGSGELSTTGATVTGDNDSTIQELDPSLSPEQADDKVQEMLRNIIKSIEEDAENKENKKNQADKQVSADNTTSDNTQHLSAPTTRSSGS